MIIRMFLVLLKHILKQIYYVPVIRTPVNRTFVVRTKYIPRYPDSPDKGDPVNAELLYKIRYPDYLLSG